MASQLQIEANRRNAQLSTGPRTPEGKAASRLNALRHGLTAQHAVVRDEEQVEFLEVQQAFEEHYQPSTPGEVVLVQQIVTAAWRLSRVRGLETGLFNRLLEEKKSDLKHLKDSNRHDHHAFVFLRDARGDGVFTTLSRYEARIERAFYCALHELERLRSAPRPEPDQTNPISTPSQPQLTESPDASITQSPDHEITQSPDSPPSSAILRFPCFGSALPPLQPVTCTSAAREPMCSTGSTRAGTAAL